MGFVSDVKLWLKERIDELLEALETTATSQRRARWDIAGRLDECFAMMSRLTGRSPEYERKAAEIRRLREVDEVGRR